MKRYWSQIVLCVWVIGMAVVFSLAHTDDTKPVTPTTRSVSITPVLAAVYSDAQKRTDEARKAVESSPQWKDYVIAQNQQESATFYIMAELSLKPSEGCVPIFDEKTKALLRFDCTPKADPKPKP